MRYIKSGVELARKDTTLKKDPKKKDKTVTGNRLQSNKVCECKKQDNILSADAKVSKRIQQLLAANLVVAATTSGDPTVQIGRWLALGSGVGRPGLAWPGQTYR